MRGKGGSRALPQQQVVHVRAVIELGGGQGYLAGDMMDGIIRATGHTQKELESVLAKQLTALQVGSFGISSVWTMQGSTAQRKIRALPFLGAKR